MTAWKMRFWMGALAAGAIAAASLPSLPGATPQQTYLSEVKLAVKRSPADFLPDGDLSKTPWKQAESAQFDHDSSGKSHYPELSTRVASLWTDAYVYFAFWSHYDSLNVYEGENPSVERWHLWDRDVVEVFLNPQPERVNHYFEFEVSPNNQWLDLEIDKTKDPFNNAAWNSGFEHATRIDTQHHIWTAEMRIPLASMMADATRPGTQWRANLFRAAGKGSDDQRKFLAWSIIPEGKTFHVPTRFGILELVSK